MWPGHTPEELITLLDRHFAIPWPTTNTPHNAHATNGLTNLRYTTQQVPAGSTNLSVIIQAPNKENLDGCTLDDLLLSLGAAAALCTPTNHKNKHQL